AQTAAKLPRVGYVTSVNRNVNVDAFEQGMREQGYEISRNVLGEYRFADGREKRVPALVADLVRLGIAVMLASNPHAIRAIRQARTNVPTIGIDLETDPVGAGWIKSLSRPGGNLTGFFLDLPELSGKQLEFLAEAMPRLQRVAVLWDAHVAGAQFKATEAAARARKFQPQSLPAGVGARLGLPRICFVPQFATAGGLMGYGPNLTDLFRRAAGYVDRILKGTAPAPLPLHTPAVCVL